MRAYIESLEELTRSQLMVLLARRRRADTEGLAVVGLGCRLPGGVEDPAGLWARVLAGRAVATADAGVPTDSRGRPRWNLAAPDVEPYAAALRTGAYLSDVDLFDAEGFGIPDEEARCLDPQHRMLLTQTRHALADAGITDPRGTRAGVFVSVTAPEYGLAAVRNGTAGIADITAPMSTGTVVSAAAGRVATAFGLRGPALTLDTACSSTLTAVHLAGQALRAGECDIAVVGAAHLLLSPITTGVFAGAGLLSATGACRPFTARADGYVRGEGAVVLVLKRERDAERDGDRPYAVIRASAVHQHGARAALGSPSAAAQQQVVRDCLRAAEVDPAEVGYVEAHGSADPVADVVEAEALAAGYRRDSADAPPLHLGSGKVNLGYLETAAGAAGLLRAVLAVGHATVPPQPDFADPAPRIPWQRTALTVPTEATPWPDTGRILAGVNAFGFTGTNAHVLLEAPAQPRPDAPADRLRPTGRSYWLDAYTWD
jgi:3-oxoacyl-[acyl-carrier-protein] synthase II